jgi:putative two-component system response regulator
MTPSTRPVVAILPRASVIVAVPDPSEREGLTGILRGAGHQVEALADPRLLVALARTADVAIIGADHQRGDDLEPCRRLRREPETRALPVLWLEDRPDRARLILALEAGANDVITRPVDAAEVLARVGSLARFRRQMSDMDSAAAIITTLAVMIESRDGYSEGHCHRMANYATALGRAIGLGDGDLQALHRGGFLHDIGMLVIPDAVLRTPGPLAPDDYALVQSHTIVGDELCANLRSLQPVRPIVRSHHEHLDGSGYPDGLSGDAVPLLAQIIGIVDVFDGITTRRAYNPPRSLADALDTLDRQVRLGWRRRDLVEAFRELAQRGRIGGYAGSQGAA